MARSRLDGSCRCGQAHLHNVPPAAEPDDTEDARIPSLQFIETKSHVVSGEPPGQWARERLPALTPLGLARLLLHRTRKLYSPSIFPSSLFPEHTSKWAKGYQLIRPARRLIQLLTLFSSSRLLLAGALPPETLPAVAARPQVRPSRSAAQPLARTTTTYGEDGRRSAAGACQEHAGCQFCHPSAGRA